MQKKFVTLVDFGTEFMKVVYGHGSMRLMSIGTTSDGHYAFRCVDGTGNEKVFKVSCWDNKAPVTMINRVEVLEHAIQYGNAAAVALLKAYGPDNYAYTRENYDDLLYLLTSGKEGFLKEDF